MAYIDDYLTVEEARNYAKIDSDVDDDELVDVIAAASRAVDRHCRRSFGLADAVSELKYAARYDRDECGWVVDTHDFQTTTGLIVAVNGTTISSDDYVLAPDDAVLRGRPYERIILTGSHSACGEAREVSVTAKWGWTTVPRAVKMAVKLQGNRVHWRRDAPQGVAGSPQTGSEIRLLDSLDVDAMHVLRDYVKLAMPA